MSLNPSMVNEDGSVVISHRIKVITHLNWNKEQTLQLSPLAQLSKSFIWFWCFFNNTCDKLSPTEIIVRKRLTVPISSALIAFCGSPGILIEGKFTNAPNNTSEQSNTYNLSFSDYFDSEDSVNGLLISDDTTEGEGQEEQRVLLHKICQLVQSVSLVFRSVNEKHRKQVKE